MTGSELGLLEQISPLLLLHLSGHCKNKKLYLFCRFLTYHKGLANPTLTLVVMSDQVGSGRNVIM